MENSGWYNNPDHSDLAIQLSDGRKIHVHKLALCTNNQYFKMAYGVASQFAEGNLPVIELKEDNPEAVDYVLRHIYKSNRPTHFQFYQSWRYWLDVYVAADKYLEPGASAKAYDNITSIARDLQNIDEIFELLETLDTRMTDYPALVDFAAELQASHLNDLLKYDRFRKHVEEEPDAMWKIVNSLNAIKPVTVEDTAEPVTAQTTAKPATAEESQPPSHSDPPRTIRTDRPLRWDGTPWYDEMRERVRYRGRRRRYHRWAYW